jgi:hypothetical protein
MSAFSVLRKWLEHSGLGTLSVNSRLGVHIFTLLGPLRRVRCTPRFCCNTWMCLPMGFGQEILPWPFFVPRMREVRQRHIGTAS